MTAGRMATLVIGLVVAGIGCASGCARSHCHTVRYSHGASRVHHGGSKCYATTYTHREYRPVFRDRVHHSNTVVCRTGEPRVTYRSGERYYHSSRGRREHHSGYRRHSESRSIRYRERY